MSFDQNRPVTREFYRERFVSDPQPVLFDPNVSPYEVYAEIERIWFRQWKIRCCCRGGRWGEQWTRAVRISGPNAPLDEVGRPDYTCKRCGRFLAGSLRKIKGQIGQ